MKLFASFGDRGINPWSGFPFMGILMIKIFRGVAEVNRSMSFGSVNTWQSPVLVTSEKRSVIECGFLAPSIDKCAWRVT